MAFLREWRFERFGAISDAARFAIIRARRGGYRLLGEHRMMPLNYEGWWISRYDQMTADYIDFGRENHDQANS